MIRITSLYLLDPLRKHLTLMGSPVVVGGCQFQLRANMASTIRLCLFGDIPLKTTLLCCTAPVNLNQPPNCRA